MTISFKVSNDTKNKLNEFYQDLKREVTPPYALFQARDGDTVVTLYESGKVVFQGKDADLASDFWVETEKMVNKKLEVNNSDKKDKKKEELYIDPKIYNSTSIGSDEVGTGDYFGPIVVTSTYVKKEDIAFLKELGVTDSKKLEDDKILKIVPEIIKKIPYSTYILTNEKYNDMNKNMNMNKIKAVLHNKVLMELTNKYPNTDYVVVDEFAKPNVYFSYLKESNNVYRKITFLTKAEVKCLSVACASLISRYVFLKEFDKLSKDIGFTLSKGASNLVDEMGSTIVKKYGIDKLREIAKLNFKNTDKIKKLIEN